MATGAKKPKPCRYKQALEKMAEDIRSQISLEKFQDRTGVSTAMIDRVRAKSYTRLAFEIQESLDIDLGLFEHKF